MKLIGIFNGQETELADQYVERYPNVMAKTCYFKFEHLYINLLDEQADNLTSAVNWLEENDYSNVVNLYVYRGWVFYSLKKKKLLIYHLDYFNTYHGSNSISKMKEFIDLQRDGAPADTDHTQLDEWNGMKAVIEKAEQFISFRFKDNDSTLGDEAKELLAELRKYIE